MYKKLNDKLIINDEQNVIEDRTLTSDQLFNKYYYLRRHFRQYMTHLDDHLIEQELLIILDLACKGWIKNKIYLRGTPDHKYKTPTFFTKHFKGYVTGYRGNYIKKSINDEKKEKNIIVYVSSDGFELAEKKQLCNDYGYEELLKEIII